ncbi:MAG: glycosyltransferase family 2 protein [Phycisphaerales bacterium]|nr:glycosyltransferase family 2 protein [Phycisphaerales bacterium]
MTKQRRIVAIIVHYRTPEMLRDAVESLLPELDRHMDEIVIVDNASGEADVAKIRSLAGEGVRVIESSENLGFAGGNNLAIQHVMSGGSDPASRGGGAEYVLLLNPDTLVRRGAISKLLTFLEDHPLAVAVGPRLEDPDGTPQQSAFGFITPIAEFIRGASIGPVSKLLKHYEVYGTIADRAHRTDWLAGACVLMRASLIERVGLLDDRFFMYFEEVDFFRRAALVCDQRLEVWHEPAAHVVHLVGQSSGVVRDAKQRKRLPTYWFESRHHYFRKHFGYLGMVAADACWFAGHLLNLTRKLLTGVSHAHLAHRETRDLLCHSAREWFIPRSLT